VGFDEKPGHVSTWTLKLLASIQQNPEGAMMIDRHDKDWRWR
jgi:hypothetical protein